MRKSHYYRLCKYKYIFSSLYFKLRDMKGKVIIKAPIKSGLIAMGLPGNEMFDYKTPCIWSNQEGTVEFNGSFGTNPGMSFVIRKDAHLTIGAHSSFGQNLRILCSEKIDIGNELLGWIQTAITSTITA